MTREKALQIFGLEPGAAPDTDAIKKAYKRLAFKLHPDHNPTPTADDDFNALTNAFAVLTCAGQGAPQSGEHVSVPPRQPGQDIECEVRIDLRQAATGGPVPLGFKTGASCPRCAGSGRLDLGERAPCGSCAGSGVIVRSHGMIRLRTECKGCAGTGEIVLDACKGCGGTGQVQAAGTTIDLPPGVSDGQVMAYPGRGSPGQGGAPPGSLLVKIAVEPDAQFKRLGSDLLLRKHVSFSDLCLGGTVVVQTLLGTRLRLRIPSGTQAGEVLSITGHGMPAPEGAGNLLVKVEPAIPRALSEEQQSLLARWRELEQTK